MIQARRSGFGGIFSLFGGREDKEIDPEIRQAVDNSIKKMVEEKRAEIIPRVLFMDETHMLDIESYSFFNRAMESELAPIIILASNRGISNIRGTKLTSPHGMPIDLLDRLLIINTRKYTAEEIKDILLIRAKEESLTLEKAAIEGLTKIGGETSLRYTAQLLSPAAEIAKNRKDQTVHLKDVKLARKLFSDVSRSVQYVKKHEDEFFISTEK